MGVLGVIGPTRMAYERVIPIVDITAKLLRPRLEVQRLVPHLRRAEHEVRSVAWSARRIVMNEDQTEDSGRKRPRRPSRMPSSRRCAARRRRTATSICGRWRSSTISASAAPGRSTRRASSVPSGSLRRFLPVRDSLEAGLGGGREGGPVGAARRAASDAAALRRGAQRLRHSRDQPGRRALRSEQARGAEPAAGAATSAPNTVLEVVQKGYELNERLLRAAKVIVARGRGLELPGRCPISRS